MDRKNKGKTGARKPSATVMAKGQDKQVSLPAVMSKIMQSDFEIAKGSRRGSIRIHGQDWIGRLPVGGAPTPGQVLGEFYINPLEYPGTRLCLFAQLYDKFRFLKLKFKYVPYTGSAVPGSVILAYDRDISDPTPPANDSGVRQFLAMQDAMSGPIWQIMDMTCPLSHPEEGLFTNPVPGGDDRLAYQGQVYVALLEPPAAGISLAGDLFIEYDLELFDPQLETQVSVGVSSVSGANKLQFGPGNSDLLYTQLPSVNPTANQTKSTAYVPKVDSNGKAYLDLAQGVYRIYQQLQQTKAGGVNQSLPNATQVVPNVSKPLPAPQPELLQGISTVTNAIGALAFKSGIYSVPPGGAKFYSAATDLSGVDSTSVNCNQYLNVDKLADAWTELQTFL